MDSSLESQVELTEEMRVSVITVSSTRTVEDDKSGQILKGLVENAGFTVENYSIVVDDEQLILAEFQKYCESSDLVISTGGTGCTVDDCTPEATLGFIDQRLRHRTSNHELLSR